MSTSAVRRAAQAAVGSALGALLMVAGARPAAAHSVEGGELPAPPWLLAYGGGFALVLVALALRTSWSHPRAVAGSDLAEVAAAPVDEASAPPELHAGHALGTLLYTGAVVAAVVGPDSAAANVAPLAVLIGWWVGLPILCLFLGDVMAAINPFQLPTALIERLSKRRGSQRSEPPPWTAAAFLASFAWFFLAYHRPGSPRALAVFLLVYAAAAVAGGATWGRGWLLRGEGFGGLSAAVSQLSWRSTRRVVPGLAALMVVWLGSTAFDAVTSTTFWGDVVGASTGWGASTFNTMGLIWLIAIVGGAYLAAAQLPDRLASSAPGAASLLRPLGLALVPIAATWFIAHDLTLLLAEGQNLIVLISDPISRGWDLFGTIDNTVDFSIVEEPWLRWLQVGLVAAGHVLALVVAHDVALRLRSRRSAILVTWGMTALAVVSQIAAVMLVLG